MKTSTEVYEEIWDRTLSKIDFLEWIFLLTKEANNDGYDAGYDEATSDPF
jgi:hypothetical protein